MDEATWKIISETPGRINKIWRRLKKYIALLSGVVVIGGITYFLLPTPHLICILVVLAATALALFSLIFYELLRFFKLQSILTAAQKKTIKESRQER